MTALSNPNEIERLTSEVARWGMEAGFLGLEDEHLECRLAGLIHESSVKQFGNCATDLERLQSELESKEIEWNAASRTVAGYRAASTAQNLPSGLVRRFFSWFRAYRDYRAAFSRCRRLEPELRRLRLDVDAAGSARNASADWQKRASETLQANYQFQKNRAALARPTKENSYDTRDTRSFILHRAN